MSKRKRKREPRRSNARKPKKYSIEEDWLAGYIKENLIRNQSEAEEFIRSYMADNSSSRQEVIQLLNNMGIYLSKLPP